ncbi:MAG TPA: hypothetical protein VKA46_41690 [Gemmataceae bacterium]|nr:hypothetical protein [Gemmataceae bacterium]
MFSFRKCILTALVLSLAVALPTFAAPVGDAAPAGSFEKYLPDSADGVVNINVRELLDSELFKKAGLDKQLAGDDAQKTMKLLGLDPLKDIERVIITNDKEKGDDPHFIIQGKFDPAKLSAAAELAHKEKKDIFIIHKTETGKIYEVTKLEEFVKMPPQAAGAGLNLKGKSVFVVIPDKGHIVLVGTKESAETVLAKAAGKKTTKLTNKELPGLIAKINPKQTIALALPAPGGDEKVKSITGGLTVTADVKVDVTVTTVDAEAAKDLNEKIGEQLKMVTDIAGLLVLQQKEFAPAIDILNGIKHEAKDGTIGIKSEIKGDTLEKLVKGLAELAAKNSGIK